MKKTLGATVAVSVAILVFAVPSVVHAEGATKSAWDILRTGNQRFVSGNVKHPHQQIEYRESLAAGQHPSAVVLTCSDSRVSPELIFDQGLGDLFVIRTAGNVVDAIGVGSIEYAVEHLHTGLVVVMGHEKCGAVTATLEGGDAQGGIKAIVDQIRTHLAEENVTTTDNVTLGVDANVKAVVRQLSTSEPVLKEKVANGLKIVGARYNLATGIVEEVQ